MADKFYKRPGIFDEDTSGFAFREVFTPLREGPLPRAKPRPSGKGGPSLGFVPLPPPGGTKSVWSASDAAANGMTLSNGGLSVTQGGTANTSIRGTNSHTSGKVYVEFLAGGGSIGNERIGLASAGFNVGGQIGQSNYSGGYAYASLGVTEKIGSVGFTTNYTTTLFPAAFDVWALAVDFTAGSLWLAVNNVWINGSNPATGTLPYISFVLATVGALFPALTMQGVDEGPWTLQPTAASQKYAPPSGFTPWDSQ